MPSINHTYILTFLSTHQDAIQHFGVERIGLFGSYVRDEQKENSDIDLLVEFSKGQKNIRNLVGLADYLEDSFGKKVELVTKESLSKYIGPHILKEVKYASLVN